MPRYPLLSAAVLCATLAACTYKPDFIHEYKIDIQQGNVLTQDMVAQLKPGQTQAQVRFLLGTPMIVDVFHQQRWDYVYRYQSGRTGQVEMRKLALFFGDDKRLERVSGDTEQASEIDLSTPSTTARLVDLGSLSGEAADKPLPPRQPPGMFRRFMDVLGF